MEEGADTSGGADTASGTTAVLSPPVEPVDPDDGRSGPTDDGVPDETSAAPEGTDGSRRRFTVAAVVGSAVAAVPFLWVLWAPWQSPNFLRATAYENNFYDLQTRAMLHGHLWLANGAVGIEAFVHGGRQYTYFGLFPSLLRMPILAFTTSLDGKLTAPFILTAWLLTALFTSMLLWRVRILIRGSAGLGRVEATTFGVLIATVLGGSVFLYLAVTPYVFNEDLAWSVALTTGSFFALLGVLERPSWGRVVASGLLMLATNLDRATTGWACVLAAVLIALWFGLGRGGVEGRRWWIPMLGAGLIPLFIGCAVNYAKFGVPFGVSNFDQVWTHVNAYRRKFLAANHNSEYGTAFIPSTLLAYLRPDGLRITSVFPFISLPAAPPRALAGVLFDRRYRTASLPASMPLLFLLSCWGLVTAFRPRPVGRAALTRILLLAGLVAGGALFIWGYISPRYLADFLPFLILASAVAVVDICRRLDGRSRSARLGALGVITVVALFSLIANLGISISPNEEFSTAQVLRYVETQHAISDVSGHPLNRRVTVGSALPPWAPADQLYVVGDCDGLYISNGENYSTVPKQQYTRTTWMTVELGHAFQHTFRLTVSRSPSKSSDLVPLLTTGATTVTARAQLISPSQLAISFVIKGPYGSASGVVVKEQPGTAHTVVVVTDPEKHVVEVSIDGETTVGSSLTQRSPVVVATQSTGPGGLLTVTNTTASTAGPTLCESLLRQ
jgi:hypothetical protein